MNARQAITTRFAGPTNSRCSRIIARCQAKRITVPWDHRLNPTENHASACIELADRLGWINPNTGYRGKWHMGWDHDENGVHVFVPD